MTLGEQRVRTTFNPEQNSKVDVIKQKAAELINLIDKLERKENDPKKIGEFVRLKSLAMTSFEEGAMWAVKACTM